MGNETSDLFFGFKINEKTYKRIVKQLYTEVIQRIIRDDKYYDDVDEIINDLHYEIVEKSPILYEDIKLEQPYSTRLFFVFMTDSYITSRDGDVQAIDLSRIDAWKQRMETVGKELGINGKPGYYIVVHYE